MERGGVSRHGADPEWSSGAEHRREKRAALLKILGDLPIFDMLTWRELEKLERIVHRRHFIADEEVLRAWVPRSGLFVVLSGSVDVVRPQEDGSQQVLDNLREGELLGEFAILDDSPRSTSIVAAEPSELVGFFRPDLMDLVQTDPRLGFKILYRVSQIMAKQLRDDIGYLRQIRSSLEMLGATKAQPV